MFVAVRAEIETGLRDALISLIARLEIRGYTLIPGTIAIFVARGSEKIQRSINIAEGAALHAWSAGSTCQMRLFDICQNMASNY